MHMQTSEDPPQDFSISAPKQVKTSRLTDEKGTSLKLQALPSYRNNCYMSLKQFIYETSLTSMSPEALTTSHRVTAAFFCVF